MKRKDLIAKILKKKDSINRFEDYVRLLNESLNSSYQLFYRSSKEEDYEELFYLIKHGETLWDESVILLNNEAYSSAVFLSIVTIEELGKCVIGNSLIDYNESKRQNKKDFNNEKINNSPLLNHRKKHQIAAFSGLAVNSRADRVLGEDNILKLFNLIKGGHLENIRQKSIYSESENGVITLPKMKFNKQDAIFFCTTAAELLCEIGGFIPSEFHRLINKITLFESKYILENYKLNIIS